MKTITKPKPNATLTPEIRAYFAMLGSRSKGGGRPRIPDELLTEAQRKRRERYENAIEQGKIPRPTRKTASAGSKRSQSVSNEPFIA